MKLFRVMPVLILPLWFGMAAFGTPQSQEEKKPENKQPTAARPHSQPGQEGRPPQQAQPREQEQPRTQQPKSQGQAPQNPRQEGHPQPDGRPRAPEQPRTQARPQEQPRPNENHAPSNSNAGRQEQPRPAQQSENRRGGGGRDTSAGRQEQQGAPQQNAQQRSRTYAAAERVPQAQERTIFQQRRSSNWGADHRDWRLRGGYVGFRIPVARFGLYFGRAHYFRLWGLPMVYVGGYPEFQYQGYWFQLLDPVPPDWAPDWYQTDQVYIDWDASYGGYYLYDASHPYERLAVDISG